MAPEDYLLIGVALVVVLNRGYTGTRLVFERYAYVALQAINLVAVVALFRFRLSGYPARLDLAVRVFLMLFVAWHMVAANQARAKAFLDRRDEQRRLEEKRQQKEELRRRLEEQDAELGLAPSADDEPPSE
jgi:hypothetical protein